MPATDVGLCGSVRAGVYSPSFETRMAEQEQEEGVLEEFCEFVDALWTPEDDNFRGLNPTWTAMGQLDSLGLEIVRANIDGKQGKLHRTLWCKELQEEMWARESCQCPGTWCRCWPMNDGLGSVYVFVAGEYVWEGSDGAGCGAVCECTETLMPKKPMTLDIHKSAMKALSDAGHDNAERPAVLSYDSEADKYVVHGVEVCTESEYDDRLATFGEVPTIVVEDQTQGWRCCECWTEHGAIPH